MYIMKLSVAILYILAVLQVSNQFHVKYVESFLKFIEEGSRHIGSRPQNKNIPLAEYDFIIVGAGTAGCTIANRLTENSNWNVLLLEAGGPENYLNSIPLFVNYLQFTNANWNHKTVPSSSSCLGLKNNQSNWAAGKGLGGTSALNYMINTRGNRKDYDTWESFGNPGWGYNDILKYFKKLESFNIPQYKHDTKYHGSHGPVPVSYVPYRTPISQAIMQAAKDMGNQIIDYNGASQIGYSFLQAHLNNGTRASASISYLHPASHRKNLHVRQYSLVDKIIINPKTKRAYGVQFRSLRRTYKVKARKEVILSAGAINSPKLLMLSGIGPEEHLRNLKIPVFSNLKVGYNLMDHVTMGGLTFLIDKPYSIRFDKYMTNQTYFLDYFLQHQGPLTMIGGCEAIAFYDLDKPNDRNGHPNLELLFQAGSLVSDPLISKNFGVRDDIYDAVFKPIENRESFMVWPILLRPKSKGRVMLKDSNPDSEPLLYHNYFENADDLRVVVDGVEKIVQLMKHPALKEMGTRLHSIPIPGCEHLRFASRKYWECQTRYLSFTLWHISGTCKMGPASDKLAVVDPRLKVYGIKNLRVIDASIMVTVPAAHTNTPTYMVAEKGADLIKEDWGFRTN